MRLGTGVLGWTGESVVGETAGEGHGTLASCWQQAIGPARAHEGKALANVHLSPQGTSDHIACPCTPVQAIDLHPSLAFYGPSPSSYTIRNNPLGEATSSTINQTSADDTVKPTYRHPRVDFAMSQDPTQIPLSVPLQPPPPGITSNFDEPNLYRQNRMVATLSATLAIALVFVIARVVSRAFIVRQFGWDDCEYPACARARSAKSLLLISFLVMAIIATGLIIAFDVVVLKRE